MAEFYFLCMEVKAVGGCAIENVSLDGTTEPFGMGTMDAQLMSATRLRIEFHAILSCKDIMCNGSLAHTMVDHLTGSIERIAGEGKGDGAFLRVGCLRFDV